MSEGSAARARADLRYMRRALALAAEAADAGEVPIGALLVDADGELLAEAGNAPIASHDPTAHAEIRVLRAAAARLGNYRLPGTTLYVTLEPCAMCAGALVHARVERIVYAADDPKAGACGSVFDIARSPALNHRIAVDGGLLRDQSASLLKGFFEARR
jgi:tRNA(adenine34) deaminase